MNLQSPTAEEPSAFPVDREAWAKRVQAATRTTNEIKAAYAAHMSKVGHHLYKAGEHVKNGALGSAQAEHRIADLHMAAARKLLPDV